MSPAEKKKKAARQSVRHPSRTTRQTGQQSARQTNIQPVIVRTIEPSMTGIRSFDASRYVIGYVLSGRKHIYSGDVCYEVPAGDIFFLSKGTHYIEDIPDGRKSFEQIMFYYTSEQIGRVIARLNVDYGTDTFVCHSCEECLAKDYVIAPGWNTLKHFFGSVKQHHKEGYFSGNTAAEMLSLTILVYYIVT